MKKLIVALSLSIVSTEATAEVDLGKLAGFTFVEERTIVGYVQDGEYKDGYTGCSYGRILVFDDKSGVACAEYNYDYRYRPRAYIFVRGSSFKIVVGNHVMNIRPVQ